MDLELLGTGRSADVYAAGEDRVLRRYRPDIDSAHEARFMQLARGLGYPVPEVFSASGRDMVLERLNGPSMLAAYYEGTIGVDDAGAILAELHTRLHRLPVPADADGPCLLHLDLHPDNVMLTDAGPVVIDWGNAGFGEAGYDVAVTSLLFGTFAVDAESPLRAAADPMLTVFLKQSVDSPVGHLGAAIAFKETDPNFTAAERGRFSAAAELIRERWGRR